MSKFPGRRWRAGSVFGAGPRVPLCRERRARFRFLLAVHRKARRLTACQWDIGTALIQRHGQDGRCDPAYETLADDAGCSVRTVGRGLAVLRALGLIAWTRRIERAAETGWQVRQVSNAFTLTTPEITASAAIVRVPISNGQIGRAIQKVKIQEEQPALIAFTDADRRAAQAALARRREQVLARLMNGRNP